MQGIVDGMNPTGLPCYNYNAFPDTDECALSMDNCDQNAVCMNTIGAFVCSCNDGFSGDGVTCTGK